MMGRIDFFINLYSVSNGFIELKLFAKCPVKQSWWNKAAQSAQGRTFADRITQARRLSGQSTVNDFGDGTRLVSTSESLPGDFIHSLFLVGVSADCGRN